MSIQANPLPDSPHQAPPMAPAALAPTRPLYWSVRRELWENRSIHLAPLVVAAVVLFGSAISLIGLPGRMRTVSGLDPVKRHAVVVRHYTMAPAPIMLATFLVGIFYALDALYGERRDRSVLFWKSLPVSDRTTVLAKASIPLVVLPLIAFALGLGTQLVILVLSTAVLVGSGVSPAILWAEVRFIQEPLVMIYGLTVHVLWFAPLYAWLLLVSAWARRTPMLWAASPIVIPLVERLAFHTSFFCTMLQYRVTGAMGRAFAVDPSQGSHPIIDTVAQLTPLRFLSTPGLWIGLALAAAFLAATVRLRRNQEPI